MHWSRASYVCRVSRSPLRGAWIEMLMLTPSVGLFFVAPPCGERGLKYFNNMGSSASRFGRSPLRGAWIEIMLLMIWGKERGSLPLAGSVD